MAINFLSGPINEIAAGLKSVTVSDEANLRGDLGARLRNVPAYDQRMVQADILAAQQEALRYLTNTDGPFKYAGGTVEIQGISAPTSESQKAGFASLFASLTESRKSEQEPTQNASFSKPNGYSRG